MSPTRVNANDTYTYNATHSQCYQCRAPLRIQNLARFTRVESGRRHSRKPPDSYFVDFQVLDETTIKIVSEVKLNGKTGAEMEALTAVSTAALTIYDMCKAVDRGMKITKIQLEEKTGGKSGHFVRSE